MLNTCAPGLIPASLHLPAVCVSAACAVRCAHPGEGIANVYKWLREAHPALVTNAALDKQIIDAAEPASVIGQHCTQGAPGADVLCTREWPCMCTLLSCSYVAGLPRVPLAAPLTVLFAEPLSPSLRVSACFVCALSGAVDHFLDALGAEASNMAIRYQATGGVYIAGFVQPPTSCYNSPITPLHVTCSAATTHLSHLCT